jgi:hypothetical protein
MSVGVNTVTGHEPLYRVELVDSGDGVRVDAWGAPNGVTIIPEHWPVLREAIEQMVARCYPIPHPPHFGTPREVQRCEDVRAI